MTALPSPPQLFELRHTSPNLLCFRSPVSNGCAISRQVKPHPRTFLHQFRRCAKAPFHAAIPMNIEINKKFVTTAATIAATCGLAFFGWKIYENKFATPHDAGGTHPGADIELVASRPNTVRFVSTAAMEDLGVKTDVVRESPLPQPLRLPGTLMIDPERLIHVHSRFSGEVVSGVGITVGFGAVSSGGPATCSEAACAWSC